MADDRLAVIERKLDGLATALADGQAKTDARLEALDTGQAKTEAGLAALVTGQAKTEAGLAALVTGQAKTEAGLAALVTGQARTDTRLAALEAGQGDLRRHMHVLHEDLVDKIKALDPAPLLAATRRELVALIETRHEEVIRRIEPIERAFEQRSRRRRS